MKYKRLGKCGVNVSEICLGTMNFGSTVDESTATSIIKKAIDLGVNFIDTANIYAKGKSEEIVGRAIHDRREDIVLATKVGDTNIRYGPGPNDYGSSRKHIIAAFKESLQRLKTDYVDILYLHRPSNTDVVEGYVGEPVPLEETLGALTELVRWGKVNYIGCSNFPAWLHCKALWTTDVNELEKFVVSQPRYSLLNREIEREIIPFCVEEGLGIVPYSVIAGGVLSGKYKAGSPPPLDSRVVTMPRYFVLHKEYTYNNPKNVKKLQEFEEFCKEIDRPMVQVALAWMLANPAITAPIVGASNLQQFEESFCSVELPLSKADLNRINKIFPGKGPYFT